MRDDWRGRMKRGSSEASLSVSVLRKRRKVGGQGRW